MLEFGLIVHPEYSFLAASPDGIAIDGTMLEIKCPPIRQVDCKPPLHYFHQMLMQLECTGLEHCDYFDAHFVQYLSKDDWEQDARNWWEANKDSKHHIFGTIVGYEVGDDDEDSDPLETDSTCEVLGRYDQDCIDNIEKCLLKMVQTLQLGEMEVEKADNRGDSLPQDVKPTISSTSDSSSDSDVSSLYESTRETDRRKLMRVDTNENQSNEDYVPTKHIYAPANMVKVDDFLMWSNSLCDKLEDLGKRGVKVTYYKLQKYYISHAKASPEWFKKNLPTMKKVWEKVELGRTPEGYAELSAKVEAAKQKKADASTKRKQAKETLSKSLLILDVEGLPVQEKLVNTTCLL